MNAETGRGLSRRANQGFRFEHPTQKEAARYLRDLSWDERIEILNQGYHRGCYLEQCYGIEDLTRLVSKRNPRDPTGGVRALEGEELVAWVRTVIGDVELADALERVFSFGDPMPEVVDTVRVVLNMRVNQYYEAFDDSDEF